MNACLRVFCLIGILAALPFSAVAATPASPQVLISPQLNSGQSLPRGESLLVGVRLTAPRSVTQAWRVEGASAAKGWTEAVTVELVAATGGARVRAQSVGGPGEQTAIVDAQHLAGGLWRFAPEDTAKLPPGEYFVQAAVVFAGGAGTPVLSRRISVAVGEAAGIGAESTLLNRARDAIVMGKPEQAVALLDPYLAAHPKARAAWVLRAVASETGGNVLAALMIVDFIQRDAASVDEAPPADILAMTNRLEAKRAQIPKELKSLPRWTWPPTGVLPVIDPVEVSKRAGLKNAPAAAQSAVAAKAAPVVSSTPKPAAVPGPTSPAPNGAKPAAAPVFTITPVTTGEPSVGIVVPAAELSDAKIKADPKGHWAVAAKASSEYGSPGYAAMQATGAPNVAEGGDNTAAWCPAGSAHSPQVLELTFAQPVHATEVRVRQSYNPGAVVKVEAIDADGAAHLWWSGIDPARPPGALNAIVWFAVRVPKTSYLVKTVRVTLDIDAVVSWQQIDAVQLVGEP